MFVDDPTSSFAKPCAELDTRVPKLLSYGVVWIAANQASERPKPSPSYNIRVLSCEEANDLPARYYLGIRYVNEREDDETKPSLFHSGKHLLGLLFVSRRVCLEAAPFLFRRPHYFDSPWTIIPYLDDLVPWAPPCIEHLVIQYFDEPNFLNDEMCFDNPHNAIWIEAFNYIAGKLKLDELLLVVVLSCRSVTGRTPKDVLEEIEWVKEVSRMTKLKKIRLVTTWDNDYIDDDLGI